MTAGSFFGAYDSPTGRVWSVLAHWQLKILSVAIAIDVASTVIALPGPLASIATIVFFGLIVIASLATFAHQFDTSLCIRCITDVPADAPACAQRRQRLLWLRHGMSTRRGAAITVVIAFAWSAIAVVADLRGAARLFVNAPSDLFLFVALYAGVVHHRLRPWCPYCRDWDGGGESEPSPDPALFGTKTSR